MNTDTPTILKKILARKREEIIEHSAVTPQSMLMEKIINIMHPGTLMNHSISRALAN